MARYPGASPAHRKQTAVSGSETVAHPAPHRIRIAAQDDGARQQLAGRIHGFAVYHGRHGQAHALARSLDEILGD